MNEFENLLSRDLEFAQNKSNRIMICLCIDCSASMLRQGAMKKVNDGMDAFLEKTNNDTLARDAADICIVSFGDTAQLVSDFGTADEALLLAQDDALCAGVSRGKRSEGARNAAADDEDVALLGGCRVLRLLVGMRHAGLNAGHAQGRNGSRSTHK